VVLDGRQHGETVGGIFKIKEGQSAAAYRRLGATLVGLLLQVLLAPLDGRRQVVVTDYVVLPINRISRVSGKLRAPTDRPF
jgi:hypothetical protein